MPRSDDPPNVHNIPSEPGWNRYLGGRHHPPQSVSRTEFSQSERTLEMKHCFTTKSRMSYGPSVQKQKRWRRCPPASRSLCFPRNFRKSCRTSGKVGAESTCSCKIHG